MTNRERVEKIAIGGSLFGGVLVGILGNKQKYSESRILSEIEIKNALLLCAEYLLDKGINEIETNKGDIYYFSRIKAKNEVSNDK